MTYRDTSATYSIDVTDGVNYDNVSLRVDIYPGPIITESQIDGFASAFKDAVASSLTITSATKTVEAVDTPTWS